MYQTLITNFKNHISHAKVVTEGIQQNHERIIANKINELTKKFNEEVKELNEICSNKLLVAVAESRASEEVIHNSYAKKLKKFENAIVEIERLNSQKLERAQQSVKKISNEYRSLRMLQLRVDKEHTDETGVLNEEIRELRNKVKFCEEANRRLMAQLGSEEQKWRESMRSGEELARLVVNMHRSGRPRSAADFSPQEVQAYLEATDRTKRSYSNSTVNSGRNSGGVEAASSTFSSSEYIVSSAFLDEALRVSQVGEYSIRYRWCMWCMWSI